MCTAVSINEFFGRTLDVNDDYGQSIISTPKGFMLSDTAVKYKILGIGVKSNGFPLYFDGVNSEGLCMAGLNFPGFACYMPQTNGKINVPSYELIPFVLGQCKNVCEAEVLLNGVSILNRDFSADIKSTPLHWLVCDKFGCIVAEPLEYGLKIYNNDIGVLTNSPDFPTQCVAFRDGLVYPNSDSSQARFAKAAAARAKSAGKCKEDVFEILNTVTRRNNNDGSRYTVYTSCIDMSCGVYYLKKCGSDVCCSYEI